MTTETKRLHHGILFKANNIAIGLQVLLLAAGFAANAAAQESVISFSDEDEIDTLHVVGSRNSGRSSIDLPVAVDTISAEVLNNSGQTELGRMLQTVVPSFNFSSSSISDGTDALRPATLRGLGPDQLLVLVNGKRRHQSALIHVNTSVGRGTAGTDINAIPASSIKRVEILRDGAAAQYGSDAIAGVINIVLHDDAPNQLHVSQGQYSEGDGATSRVALNLNKHYWNGFIQANLEYRNRDHTNRAGLSANCQYPAGCADTDADGIGNIQDPRELTFNRQNFRIGDADSEQFAGTLNTSWELDSSEVYGFVSYSHRDNQSAGFYRRAIQRRRNPLLPDGEAFAPDGFLPLINTDIEDISFSIGYLRNLTDSSTMDLSLTSGRNSMGFYISNSVNASFVQQQINAGVSADEIRNNTQRTADAGTLSLGLTTFNVDLNTEFDSYNVAYGLEYREDSYEIEEGEEYSYLDYDLAGLGGAGGIQVFPGFQPNNAVDETRNVVSAYVDIEYDASDALLLSSALRFDHYQGFGSTINLKAAARYDVSSYFALRGAFNTGFRAPSMQQLHFNNVSTQFIGGVPAEVGTFRNSSALAQDIGLSRLKEESSKSISTGLVFTGGERFSATIDLYHIEIADRIVISERLRSGLGSASLDQALLNNGVSSAQFFVNAADTKTQGIDIVGTYDVPVKYGSLNTTFALNVTDTEITDIIAPPGLVGLQKNDIFGPQARSIIEQWQPNDHLNMALNYRLGQWNTTLNISRFGEYTIQDGGDSQTFAAEWLTDIRVSYQVTSKLEAHIGANNLFNNYPDRNRIGQSGSGILEDDQNNVVVQSDGVFQYSRRAAPFGFNGAYFYAGINYQL